METNPDVLVLGGGVAGLSAALTLGRSRRSVTVLDGGEPRNAVTGHMHGLLTRDGTPPLELLAIGRDELARYGVDVTTGRAIDARRDADGLVVTTEDGRELRPRRLLVATGLRDELPDVPGLAAFWGRGVAHCPYCDGWEVRDRPIGVLATGPHGLHQAQLLRQLSPDLVYLAGADGIPAGAEGEQALAALDARGIRVERTPVVRAVGEGGRLTGVTLADGRELALDAVFAAPTPVPRDEVLVALGAERRDLRGLSVAAVDEFGRTSVPGVWAAGNVVDPWANVPVSIGQGAWAGAQLNGDLVTEEVADAVRLSAAAGSPAAASATPAR
jgi:thioredoxin reductase